MYGMGGMAKDVLRNTFLSKSKKKTSNDLYKDAINPMTGSVSLGHIESRAAARNIIDEENRPTFYIPPRVLKTDKSSNTFKGATLKGCKYINGDLIDTVLTGCIIDGNKNTIINVDLSNITVSGLADINKLKVSRVVSNLIPSITQTYDIGTNLLQWNYIYGKYLDASYGLYVGGTTNGLSIERPTDSGNTNVTNSIGDLVIDNTNTTGATIVQLGTDTADTDFQIKNNSGTTLFEVNGAGEATITGCTVIDDIKICNNQIGHATDDTDLLTLTSGVLTVAGNVTASAFIMTSDKRLKKQIKNLDKEYDEETLDLKFEKLEPVKFKWKKQAANSSVHAQSNNNMIKEKYQYGLIAQNVLEEFPECAFTKPDGHLGIDYMGLTSVLILKMQNQNKEIKEKDQRIDYLENTVKKQEIILNNLLQRIEKLENSSDNDSMSYSQISRSWDKDRDYDHFNGNRYGGGGGGGNSYSSSY